MSPIEISKAKSLYSELISLTQLFLLRDHRPEDRVLIERDSYRTIRPRKTAPTPTPVAEEAAYKKPISIPPVSPVPEKKVPSQPVQEIPKPLVQSKENIQEIKPAQKKNHDKPAIDLEPGISVPENTADLSYKQFFAEHYPNFPLSDSIPSDHLAIKARDYWMIKQQILPVIILAFDENNQALSFLKNIAKAITLRFAPACVLSGSKIEKEQQWENILSMPTLRLIIACDYELYMQKGLMQFYQQSQHSSIHHLKNTPLLLLSDLSIYLKKPELKALLWNAICNEFKASGGKAE